MANEFIRLMPADSLVDDRSDQTIGGIKSFSNLTKFLNPEGVYLDRIHSLDSKTILDKTATQLSVGHSELDLVLNSKSKPTWNQSALALVSDIPTKISQLNDDSKFLRYTQQSLTDDEKSVVRANIGAGTSNLTVNDVKTVKVDRAVNADSAGKVGHQLSILSGGTSTIVFDGSADRKVDFSTTDFSLESVDGKVNISLLDKGYATVTQVNAKYTKPENGIPLNDLAQSVRASLSKADTALQANALDNYALKSYVDGKIPTKTSQLTNDSSFLQFIAQSLTDTQKQQARTNIGAGTSNLTTNDVKLVKVDNAVNADSATSASKALSADKAKNADNAVNAEKALNADHATSADSAVSADHATSADSATTATRATNADHATSADSAGKVINKFYVHDEDKSTSIAFDGSGDKNLYFKSDFLIEKDSTSYHVQLKDSGVVAGTYNSVTIDSKGRVTSGTNQPYGGYTKPSGGIPKSDLAQSVQDSLNKADSALQASSLTGYAKETYVTGLTDPLGNRISSVEGKIPTAASSSNQLADKAFVNSTVNSLSAFYITSDANRNAFATKAKLLSGPYFYQGKSYTPTTNDYAIVLEDESQPADALGKYPTTRYLYDGKGWGFQIGRAHV